MVFVLFSYKQVMGKGGNHYVARVKTILKEKHNIDSEMRHSENVGIKPGDTKKHPGARFSLLIF